MITELKKKEILSVKEMLDLFKAKIESFKSDMDAIDRKYRELADEEKKELKQNVAEYKSQQKAWQKMFNSFDSTAVKEVLGENFESDSTEEETSATVETDSTAEEEKVVDTIFPENNENSDDFPFSEEDTEKEIEEEKEEPVEKTSDEDWETEEEEETKEEEFTEEPASEESSDVITDNDNDWPEFPEEWK